MMWVDGFQPENVRFEVEDLGCKKPQRRTTDVASLKRTRPSKGVVKNATAKALKDALELCEELGTPHVSIAAPAMAKFFGPRRWLVDTGSAFDLVGRKDVPEAHLSAAEPARRPIQLKTANGVTTVDEEIILQCGPLKEHVYPLLLDSTPAVLSVGRRCMEDGFSFHWPAGGNPVFVSPNGTQLVCEVDNFVPYLPERPLGEPEPQPAAPSPEAAPPASGDAPVPVVPVPDPVGNGAEAVEDGDGGLEPEVPEPDLLPFEGRDLKAEAVSVAHLMTHMPKNPHCHACQTAKIQAKPAPRRTRPDEARPKEFGELVTADHLVLGKGEVAAEGQKCGLVVFDRGTAWIECYAVPNKS
jgi:hypothetical protein